MNTFLIQVNTQTDTAEISAPRTGSGDAPETSLPFGTLLDQALQSAPQSAASHSKVSQSNTALTEDSPNLAEEAPLAEGQTVIGQTIDPVGLVLSSLGSMSLSSLVAPTAEAPAALNNGQPIHADASLFLAHSNPVLSLGGDTSSPSSTGESGGTHQQFGHAFSSPGNGSAFTGGAGGTSAGLVPAIAGQENPSLQLPAQLQAQLQTKLQTQLQTGMPSTTEILPAVDAAATSPGETSSHTATQTGRAIPAEAGSAAAEASRAQMAAAISEFTTQDGTQLKWGSSPGDEPSIDPIIPGLGKRTGQSPAPPVQLDSPLRPPQNAAGHRENFPATEGLLTQNRAASLENSEIPATELPIEENPADSPERGTTQKASATIQETAAASLRPLSDATPPSHGRHERGIPHGQRIVRNTESLTTAPPEAPKTTPVLPEVPKAPTIHLAAVDHVFSRRSAEAPQQGLGNLRSDDLGPQGRIVPDAQAHDAPADSSGNPDHPGQEFSDPDPANHELANHELSNKGRAQVEEFVVPGAGVLFRGRELASMVSAEQAQVGSHISGEHNSGPATPRAMSQAPVRTETQLPTAQAAGENSRAQASGVVNSARLLERLGETEMQIAFRSEALGSVNLRAVVRENAIGAAIGVERADVRAHLISELPALEQALSERNLKVENITISQGSTGGGTALSSGSDSHSRAFAQPQQPLPDRSGTDGAEHDPAISESAITPEASGLANGSTRLDLHV